eukprot:753953-Hanusia_phi.AAC.3
MGGLVEEAFNSVGEDNAEDLQTMRAGTMLKQTMSPGGFECDELAQNVLKEYASKQSIGATLRQILNRLLIKQPDDPVLYMINSLENWQGKLTMFHAQVPSDMVEKVLKVCVLGPPGSGKKTLCEMVMMSLHRTFLKSLQLSKRLGLEHVCPADLVSGFCETAKETIKTQPIDTGSDEKYLKDLILERLKDGSCEEKVALAAHATSVLCALQGWIMDSWPQNAEQASLMITEGCCPHVVIKIEVPDRIVEDRITFRTLHVPSGTAEATAHVECGTREIEIDGQTPLENYEDISDLLARQIGI